MYRYSLSQARDLSLNDLRIALVNFLSAKHANESFIVRVDDADRTHNIEDKDRDSLDILALFGISYTQLYYQSHNFKYHLQFASTLLDKKKAFICFCAEEKSPYDGACENLSSEEVLNNPRPFVIRMKKQAEGDDSCVIMKTDKYPTPLFARACDDMLQGVTTIIDEEAHRSEASKEEWIRKSLGYDQAMHCVYIPSFQETAYSVQQLLDEGFMPEAIANYLLAPHQILTFEQMLKSVDLHTNMPTSFEMETLRFINREHIKKLGDMELSKRLGFACENIGKLAKVYTDEADTTYAIKQKMDAIFAKKEPHESPTVALQELLLKAPYFEAFEDFLAYLETHSTLQGEALHTSLRFWLTGAEHGPELSRIYPLLKTYLKEIVR